MGIAISLTGVNEYLRISIADPTKLVYQLGDRVNFFLPNKEPIWWELKSTAEDLEVMSDEITGIINNTILPLFKKYTEVSNVIELCKDADNHRWFNGGFEKTSLLILLLLATGLPIDPTYLEQLKKASHREKREEEYQDFIEEHLSNDQSCVNRKAR